ncbi:MAG: hypothetical protein ACTHMS_17925 [Jatrophihabitans sp.]|uniref:hypothetical protein n=1 Tax=Jatrophihabitans sp. TaxID=1932789 RepID=UPI003F8228BB
MPDYVLRISYGEDDEPVDVPLTGLSPEDAETKRQALAHELQSGIDMHAPPVSLANLDADLPDVTVDTGRVTEVDLLDADTA